MALKLFSVIFRKCENDGIRMSVHLKMYGPKTQRNELTKRLILTCHKLKKGEMSCASVLLAAEDTLNLDVKKLLRFTK